MSISCAILAPNYESSYYLIMLSFLFVLLLAYFTTRWLSKSKISGSKGRNIHVVERMFLSSDKQLLIVQVGEEYILMSQDKSGLKFIEKLIDFQPVIGQETSVKFSDILDKLKNNKDK